MVGGFEFAPLTDSQKNVTPGLESVLAPILTILSGYADRRREPLTNCVVLSKIGADWDSTPEDMPAAKWATSLLFLA
jgi:hypothetical protein